MSETLKMNTQLHPFRCETCKFAKITTTTYGDGDITNNIFCSVLNDDVTIISCGEINEFKILGCASHSSANWS